MSFNWRLLLAPEEILDYVVEHEVAHLAIHDHSARFWTLLESRCPEYADARAVAAPERPDPEVSRRGIPDCGGRPRDGTLTT